MGNRGRDGMASLKVVLEGELGIDLLRGIMSVGVEVD